MKLKQFTQTCSACPSQWEGITEDNRPIYVRYRWGYLSICIGKENSDVWSAVQGREIYGKELGDGFDGTMDEDRVLNIIERL